MSAITEKGSHLRRSHHPATSEQAKIRSAAGAPERIEKGLADRASIADKTLAHSRLSSFFTPNCLESSLSFSVAVARFILSLHPQPSLILDCHLLDNRWHGHA
jgi:hypothetical protein